MLYHLFQYLNDYHIHGARLFGYVSFRFALSLITSLLIATFWGQRIINKLRRLQIGESIRDLSLEGQMQKKGTPTMGGFIIILAIIIPTLLFCRLDNIYVLLMIFTTLISGGLGFIDDYIKIFKHNKEGLRPRYKLIGQVLLGLVVGIALYTSPQVVIKPNTEYYDTQNHMEVHIDNVQIKSTATTIPFVKEHNLNYKDFIPFIDGPTKDLLAWALYVFVVVFIVTMLSNCVNLTDGLDGLASGSSAIVGVVLGILAYVSSHANFSQYLNIMYIPGAEELVIFAGAVIGSTIGFLWYNSYPAQVFMGDTGSLALGGIIGVFAILIRKELLLPIFCGVFIVEGISVLLQQGYYKYTRMRTGTPRRIFKMAPLHHHFQIATTNQTNSIIKKPNRAYPEAKITMRFMLIGIILAVITIITLKIR